MFEPARKDEVANQMSAPHRNRDKRHPHLESNPGFLWKDFYGPAFLDHSRERVE